MDLKKNTKELVKSRLKKTAAKSWGYQESDAEGFDPVIDLLFGACATEFERLSTELYTSQKRILEKVSQILLPEVFLCPVPSYAIMHGKPSSTEKTTTQTDQFVFKKEFPGKTSEKPEQKKIYFSPLPGFRLINAELVFLATSSEILQVNNGSQREIVFQSETQKFPHESKIWLGLKIDPQVESLKNVSFYFDWYNNPDRNHLLKLLRVSQWFMDGKSLSVKTGFSKEIDRQYDSETTDINSYLNLNIKTEKRITQFFENQFITITDDSLPVHQSFPSEFPDFYQSGTIDKLTEELCWIEIKFPEIFPVSKLSGTHVSPTAFPVLNRRLHDSNRPHTLNKDLNILPIITADQFFAIRDIVSSNQIKYQEVPFKRVSDFAPGTFTVRTEGLKRFDKRDAYEYVQYLQELLREEYIAFESMGSSLMEKELNELQVIINRLRLNVTKSKETKDNALFVIIKSQLAEDVWLQFWSTAGASGNNIPAGSVTINTDFDKKNLKLLTSSFGGKNSPDQIERIALFKHELLTRNRIVTREDIKMACFAELGNKLEQVEISQKPILSGARSTGFQNCIHILLNFKEAKSENEKENMISHMEKTLQQKSSCIYKYHVEIVE